MSNSALFSRATIVVFLNELQNTLTGIVSRTTSLLQDSRGITVFYSGSLLTSTETSQLQNAINGFVDLPSKQDLLITGNAIVQGATTSSTLLVSSTTDSTGSGNGALVLNGGLGVAKHAYFNSGLDAGNNIVTSVAWPLVWSDAVNKGYVDQLVAMRNPMIFENTVSMSTTSTIYVTYLTGTVSENGSFRINLSCQYSSTNVIGIRLLVGDVVLGYITVHAGARNTLSWNELFDNVSMTAGTTISLQVCSSFGGYVSTITSAFIELVSWNNVAPQINTKCDQAVSTTSTTPIVYLTWTTPMLQTGIYRLRVSFVYTGQNLYTCGILLDGNVWNTITEHISSYETKSCEFFQDLTFNTASTHNVTMNFASGDGRFLSTTQKAYMEFEVLSA